MDYKKTSLVIPKEIYWKAVSYGAKNEIKGGFKGVVVLGIKQLLSLKEVNSCQCDKSEVGKPHVSKEEKGKEEGLFRGR